MLFRWRKKMKQARFYRQTRAIFDTPPMPVIDAPWTIASIVTGNHVQMYLLAMKSFYARLGRGKIVLLTNRETIAESGSVLERHFPGIRFVLLNDIDTGACQRGGCWERLIYLIDRSQQEYAIQLDSDTLTIGDIPEVLHCAENNIPFASVGRAREFVSLPKAAEEARAVEGGYVGLDIERLFDRYPGGEALKYVRGSAGFAGFSKGGANRAMIEDFHHNMAKLMGARWSEWGTEQCASNFAIANSPGAIVLPHPKYAIFTPRVVRGRSAFIHFIGSHRYLDDYYALRGQEFIETLLTGAGVRKVA